MSTKNPPPPRGKIWVEERTPHHVVGVYDDIVLVAAFEGSQNDPLHLETTSRVIIEHAARLGTDVRFVFAMPEAHRTGAPSAEVRAVAQRAVLRVHTHVARAAIVVGGEGFGIAIHRAVITGTALALRLSSRLKSFGDMPSALAYILGDDAARRERVLRFYEEELLQPAGRARLIAR